MDWLQVISLALIQGLTEFLPISSSAHLILPAQLLNWPDQGLAFDVGVHLGTLLAVVAYFRRELLQLARDGFGSLVGRPGEQTRLAWLVVLATLPAIVAGYLGAELIDHYTRSVLVIAATTLIFGALLWWADEQRSERRDLAALGWRDGLLIGISQALALIPGTSRSGVTITAALLLGFDRQAAARFSFLLSVPVIMGAALYKGLELADTGSDNYLHMVAGGTAVAAVSAFACIHLFLRWLDRIGMKPFVIYRLLLGVLLLGLYFSL
ncbi:undecaprenyl-diphosphate phosphatase [Marinobacterium arenosum]|uniref:undecaprenyl-diphosphate phosphatase n=1 Tax=Marinobacterium arenosum TaxID=2862496 RepID=UPI001C975F41|nr:undecaprenyl-diphosphate phosphatase [Marinobacterium arenosum]MBY4679000.1 undecaprenyl-diphosphate phosphatase [Marinobacterium arenosum]